MPRYILLFAGCIIFVVCIEAMTKLQKAVDESNEKDTVAVVDKACETFTGKHKKIVRKLFFIICLVLKHWRFAELPNTCR